MNLCKQKISFLKKIMVNINIMLLYRKNHLCHPGVKIGNHVLDPSSLFSVGVWSQIYMLKSFARILIKAKHLSTAVNVRAWRRSTTSPIQFCIPLCDRSTFSKHPL